MKGTYTIEAVAKGQAGGTPSVSVWRTRTGLGLSALATLFFLLDASGKLLRVEPVMKSTVELGWPVTAVVPLGCLLVIGAVLYAVPRTAVLGAIYLTGFLGGAIATHYRIGSPLFTHVLFGVYVAVLMWAGLALRFSALLAALCPPAKPSERLPGQSAIEYGPPRSSARRYAGRCWKWRTQASMFG